MQFGYQRVNKFQDEAEPVFEQNDFQISDVVLIDRWIDPLTPLLVQLTYAGLVDELLDMGPTGFCNLLPSPWRLHLAVVIFSTRLPYSSLWQVH